jgi:CRP/FNR family cyclic AMP-dependent transcriptional regulator
VSAPERLAGLAGCPLFEGLDAEALHHLAEVTALRRVAAGEAVIREGDEGDSLFVILEGRARAEKRTPAGDSWTVRFLDQGSVFGELSLLEPLRRSATVIAEAVSTLLVIDRQSFHEFGDRHPRAGLLLTRRLAERLGARLRRANEDVVTLFTALVHEVERKL